MQVDAQPLLEVLNGFPRVKRDAHGETRGEKKYVCSLIGLIFFNVRGVSTLAIAKNEGDSHEDSSVLC